MKNFSLALNVVLFIAVAVLYVLHFTSKGSSSSVSDKVENVTVNPEELKGAIVYVNMDSVMANYTLYKELSEMFGKRQEAMNRELYDKSAAFEKKSYEFQEKVQKGLITRRQAEEMQQKLMAEQQALVNMKDQMGAQLMEAEQSMNKQIYDSINSFLNDYNKVYNHPYIIRNVFSGTLLYGNPHFNITDTVLTGLNTRYGKPVATK